MIWIFDLGTYFYTLKNAKQIKYSPPFYLLVSCVNLAWLVGFTQLVFAD